MKYINRNTQGVIETSCVISSPNWDLVKSDKKQSSEEKPKTKPKTSKKKDDE